MDALQLWGGVECTVNRVNEEFHNQLRSSGHDERLDDLDRIADLGLRRLRYPVLWELTAPITPDLHDWHWADQRLGRLRELGIDPIVGLMHHGSGPRYTSLLDENFPTLFARYAKAVACRYPWINAYTPINEPLTTARFSALYGHWYPHRCDDRSFVRALVNQCRATVLAMREIRRVNPAAQLIQTDDIGCTSSSPKLCYQAKFDNERRWLAWDLLCGKVDSEHAIWGYLRGAGASEAELLMFREQPCPPDLIGINHYVTSDRHLHEQRRLFPRNTWGGNRMNRYADVEAVRVTTDENVGMARAVRDAWHRYELPIAITEVHLGCTREEQLRWLHEAWETAGKLRTTGVDVRAITVWALFGSYNWNSLLTTDGGYYEAGAFDVRGPTPRRTALAALTKALATGTQFEPAAVLEQPGWWHRPERLFPSLRTEETSPQQPRHRQSRPLLICSAMDVVGSALEKICEGRGLDARMTFDEASAERMLDDTNPWAVIDAGTGPSSNHTAALAQACAQRGIRLLMLSSARGLSPTTATEQRAMLAHPSALIIRTNAWLGGWDSRGFLNTALDLLIDGDSGLWRWANDGCQALMPQPAPGLRQRQRVIESAIFEAEPEQTSRG
jgi:dTDP-4-dehydrorhamnose reductase